MNLYTVPTMTSGKLACLACRSSVKLASRSKSSSLTLNNAGFVQRRIVGSRSLPSAQARTVVRTAFNHFPPVHQQEQRSVSTVLQAVKASRAAQQQQGSKALHSSAHQEQPSLAGGIEFMSMSQSTSIPRPTFGQLKELFFASSISFIGFGFMDNFIMIQAGGYIDATLGVKLGLATMTAAAMGQVISDVSGVLFGGTLERFLKQKNLIKEPSLSVAQRGLSICRNTSMAGAAVGVMLGCFLGACSLMFVDLEYHERQKNAMQLRNIVHDMMSSSHDDAGLDCEACTVFLTEGNKGFASLKPDSQEQQSSSQRIQAAVDFLQHSGVERAIECAEMKKPIISACDQALYVPVVSVDGSNLLAVIEFRNKQSSGGVFTTEDEQTAKIMARHVAIFMQHLQ